MKKNSTMAMKQKQIFQREEADDWNGPGRSIHDLLSEFMGVRWHPMFPLPEATRLGEQQ